MGLKKQTEKYQVYKNSRVTTAKAVLSKINLVLKSWRFSILEIRESELPNNCVDYL